MRQPTTDPPTPDDAAATGVVVLGPGRSGTSSISAAFVAAGYFAGREDEVLGAGIGNPLGHYEPLPVLELNEELMSELGCSWWAGLPDPAGQLAALEQMQPRIASTLEALATRAEGKPLVVKEPRINSLLPLWGPLIDGLFHPVLAVREPIEIALSQARRDGTAPAHALAAWEAQMAMVLDWLQGRTVTVAPYRELLSRQELAVDLVAEASGHLLPELQEGVAAEAAAKAIDPQQRNEMAAASASGEYLTARQSDLWQFLSSLPAGDVVMDAPDALRTPAASSLAAIAKQDEHVSFAIEHQRVARLLKDSGERSVALGSELAEARQRSGELERELAESRSRAAVLERELDERAAEVSALTDSVSWRVTAPLRRLHHLGRRL